MQKKNIEDLHRNDIAALLIMPIQRIPRYVLLLSVWDQCLCVFVLLLTIFQDLVKHTEPDHSDYKNLQQAVSHITSIAEFVNHKKQEADNLGRLLIIQQHIHGLTEVCFSLCVFNCASPRAVLAVSRDDPFPEFFSFSTFKKKGRTMLTIPQTDVSAARQKVDTRGSPGC